MPRRALPSFCLSNVTRNTAECNGFALYGRSPPPYNGCSGVVHAIKCHLRLRQPVRNHLETLCFPGAVALLGHAALASVAEKAQDERVDGVVGALAHRFAEHLLVDLLQ